MTTSTKTKTRRNKATRNANAANVAPQTVKDGALGTTPTATDEATKPERKPMNPKRAALIELSGHARILVQAGACATINDALKTIYRDSTGAKEFNTLHQWNEHGFKVKKGEKALLLWTRPMKFTPKEKEGTETEFEYYGICYVFTEHQVEPHHEEEKPTFMVHELEAEYLTAPRKTTPAAKPLADAPTFYGCAEVEISYKPKPVPIPCNKITCSRDAFNVYTALFNPNTIELKETFWLLLLNNANKVTGAMMLSSGGITGTVVDARLLFQPAILTNATSFVIAHNHPSGNLKPSQADIDLTRKIKDAGKLLEIKLMDHLILSVDGYYSFADEGML